MKRYILTGAPGAGKTTILRRLSALGYATVDEAATAVIAREQALGRPEPWTDDGFVDRIIALQRHRQTHTPASAGSGDCSTDSGNCGGSGDSKSSVQIYDRSPVCTHALSVYLGREPTPALRAELKRIADQHVYQREVFFIGNLGFCEPTAARRISFEESLAFERVHRDSYAELGYTLVDIPAGPVDDRVARIVAALSAPGQGMSTSQVS